MQSIREDLEVRRLEYERVKAQIKARQLESPIDGLVVQIDKEVGEFVAPTDPVVMHIVQLSTLKAVFSVPMQMVESLEPGRAVNLLIGFQPMKCQGVIEFVSPIAEAQKRDRSRQDPNPQSGPIDTQRCAVPLGSAVDGTHTSCQQRPRTTSSVSLKRF